MKEDARIIRTKRDLANALEELLQERKFDDLSIKDITDKALISKNTFYNNFHDKNELLTFLFNRYKDELITNILPLFEKITVLTRKIFFRIITENVIKSFYESKIPFKQLILNDTSHTLYFFITKFIDDSIRELDKSNKFFISKKSQTKITSTFFAGAFASTIYFCISENKEVSAKEMTDSIVKLTSSLVS